MKTRLYQSSQPVKRAEGPSTPAGWSNLLARVIDRARELEDKRLPGLTRAMVDGRAEKMLRSLGVLSEVDITREFPD